MSREMGAFELLRVEMELVLLPELFYRDESFENVAGMDALLGKGEGIAYLFASACRDDGIALPFEEREFGALGIRYRGITVYRIDFPHEESGFRRGIRAYLLFRETEKGEVREKLYFLKERDGEGNLYFLYVSPSSAGREPLMLGDVPPGKDELEFVYESYLRVRELVC